MDRRSFDDYPVVKPVPVYHPSIPIRIRRMSALPLEEPVLTHTQIVACGGGVNAVRNQATREAPKPVVKSGIGARADRADTPTAKDTVSQLMWDKLWYGARISK